MEFVKARGIIPVAVVDGLPGFPKQAMGFVDISGVSVVSGVVVDGRVCTMVVFDVAVVIFYGTFLGVIFVFLFRIALVCFLELDDVVVEVVDVGHVRGLDVVIVRNLADFIVHVSGVVVMLLWLRLCESGVVCGVVAYESSGRQSVWFVVDPVISRGLFFIVRLGATEPLDDSSLDFLASVYGALDAVCDAGVRLLEESVEVGALVNRLEGHAVPSFVFGSVLWRVAL